MSSVPGGGTEAPSPYPVPCLLHLVHLLALEVHPLTTNRRSIKQTVSWSSMNQKINGTQGGVFGTQIVGTKYRVTTWACDWHSELEGFVGTSYMARVQKYRRQPGLMTCLKCVVVVIPTS